jgi:hypothetical protein
MASIEFGNTHKEAQSPDELWSYASGGDGYAKGPKVAVAEYMEKKGLGVSVRLGERGPGIAAIYASPQGKRALDKIVKTPEFSAISEGLVGHFGEPEVEKCKWDKTTKQRVQALYWQSRRRYAQHLLENPIKLAQVSGGLPWITGAKEIRENCAEYLRTVIQEAELKEQELLGSGQPLSASEVGHLLEEVVDKYLSTPPSSKT